ncbi:hypothetical protein CAEBREN_13006 [Caenorhabditis brenneri]|uniref:Uncharacterized protein n=1 Tax=Caenorhabditis brenneri TaxID=135651 RepID=G0MGW6_CAEBE|nr:hypothetical protein CAEBREN_13006 [Caenorhabditis brenneri]
MDSNILKTKTKRAIPCPPVLPVSMKKLKKKRLAELFPPPLHASCSVCSTHIDFEPMTMTRDGSGCLAYNLNEKLIRGYRVVVTADTRQVVEDDHASLIVAALGRKTIIELQTKSHNIIKFAYFPSPFLINSGDLAYKLNDDPPQIIKLLNDSTYKIRISTPTNSLLTLAYWEKRKSAHLHELGKARSA